jgi:hypothetical protein
MTTSTDATRPFPAEPPVRLATAPRRSVEPDAPPLRASDADRMATVLVLQEAIANGCLTPAEGSDRMAAAFAAVHRRDLDPLVADLPKADGAGFPAPSGPRGFRRGRPDPTDPRWRLVLLVGLALLLMLMFGSIAAHLVFDNGPGGPGGFGGRPTGGGGPGGGFGPR